MKDIFIDTNIALHFSNPLTDSYKSLVKWFVEEDGCLVVSQKLIAEYIGGNAGPTSQTNIAVIINFLQTKGRLNKISNNKLDGFILSKKEEKSLTCNYKDQVHIKTVCLSDRKLAISNDERLRNDINGFRKIGKIQPYAVAEPDHVDYRTYP